MTTPEHSPNHAIIAVLEQYQPAKLLVCADAMPAVVTAWLTQNTDCDCTLIRDLSDLSDTAHFDLAIIAERLESLDKPTAMTLVAGLRNRYCERIALLLDPTAADNWLDTDIYSLGLRISERFQRDCQTLWFCTYDIASYKTTPDWLNAKHWANPEHFGKYWW
ncbi:DUF6231 family protein [Kistimonas scapharcae]|uniref:DUF6231 family protein n=1 Tax=Kistimonas scapharcae TaxID=1036133 RepID=A0ABP8V1R9_9GAMM